MKRRKLSASLLSIAVALGIFAPFRSAYGAKTFVYCSEGSPNTFNPELATDSTSLNATNAVFDKLVRFQPGTTTIIPGLAESWQISKDGLSYTFKLRKNVKFHTTANFIPSRNFNADDLVFSINRQRLKEHPYHDVGKATYESFDSMGLGKLIKDVVKVDDYTVRFILSEPSSPFLADLTMEFACVLSAEYGDQLMKKKTPEKIDIEPVGTGAFTFVRYDKDQMIRYKANADYWDGKPKIDNLVFSITTDASVRYQRLKAGECHLIAEPSPSDIDSMKKEANIKLMELAGLNVAYLAFNVEKKPFDNILVRQAINYALNRKSYIDAIYLGHAKLAKNPLPPGIWSYDQKISDYDYNPEKAKELLKKAGFPDGLSMEIWTLPVSRVYNPNGKKMGEMMQADLQKVGIKVKLVTYDWPTYIQKTRDGEHQTMMMGWIADNGDPDNFLDDLLSCDAVGAGANRARWCYQPYNELVRKAQRISNKAERTKLYEQAQVIFKEQAPWVTLAHAIFYRAMSKRVTGYSMDLFCRDYFNKVDLN